MFVCSLVFYNIVNTLVCFLMEAQLGIKTSPSSLITSLTVFKRLKSLTNSEIIRISSGEPLGCHPLTYKRVSFV